MKTVHACVAIVVIFAFAGCHRITYKVESGSGSADRDIRWRNYFLFGLAPVSERFDQASLCRSDPLLEVHTYHSPVNIVDGLLSLGLTSGGTLESICGKR